jgi:hypothetical protein
MISGQGRAKMKKLLILVFVGLLVSCVEVKRPGLELQATIDTRAVKTAINPDSDYSPCKGLVAANKGAYIQCDADGSFMIMPSSGNTVQDPFQSGVWQNENANKIVVKIMRDGSDNVLMTFTVKSGSFSPFKLYPGKYTAKVSFFGATGATTEHFVVDIKRGNAWAEMANQFVDFVRTTPAS